MAQSITIEEEMLRLGELQQVGMALLQFAHSLAPGEFSKKSAAWIYQPDNFVGFEIRHKQTKRLNVLVRPTRVPDNVKQILKCWAGHFGYGRIEINSPRQLAAACAYIEGSWKRPRRRRH